MNAIKRFVDLLTLPLKPIRMFAVEDDSDYDWTSDFDFSGTDEEAGYYDADGNYLGDDEAAAEAAAESHDDSSIDPDNWAEYDDDFGEVDIKTDGNGNVLGVSYKDPETGERKESNLSGYKEAYGRSSEGQNKQAVDIFGASMTPETLAALNTINSADASGLLSGAQKGDPVSLAQLTVLTGTIPDADSLKGLGYTDEQINTLNSFAGAFGNAIRNGHDPVQAWGRASLATGNPYGNLRGGQVGTDTETWKQYWNAMKLGGTETIDKVYNKPGSEKSTEDKTPAVSSTKKSDPAFTNPFNKGEPEISVPKGPLEGTPLGKTGLPGSESESTPTKEDAEERGFESDDYESDDSGADTFEESSQDSPTSGLGGETFSNPNNDNERKEWGLGEEDPNRANYDTDKWNRGMERVSTDVVSDEKCKNFINKTFRNDPVLIKTVKIMKTLK